MIPENRPRSALAEALRISDLGLRLVIAVAAGFFGGLYLDRWIAAKTWGASLAGVPLFAVVGTIVGFGTGMYALVRGLSAGERTSPRSRSPETPEAPGSGSNEAASRPGVEDAIDPVEPVDPVDRGSDRQRDDSK